ncbi:MAG TPA: ATP-binding protein [Bryobacteraceae bacterium]|nr:ATP-binding protein [Bryobacteraceae bacterium]
MGFRSLATKFFLFTAALLFWVVLTLFGLDLRHDSVDWIKWAMVSVMVVLVAGGLSRFTTKLLARPLILMEEAIHSVTEGRPEPIQVSRTGDEIEFLGNSFNRMIDRLMATQNEVRQHQELLEDRIRQRTEELERAMQQAQEASHAKSEFLANMSHELRTPMNGVLGMMDIVLDSPLTADQREQLETAQRCANSLLSLLNDVLDLSKIEAGKMLLERIPFDLRVLIDDAVRAQRPKASKKGIVLSVEVAPSVPRKITADPLRMRQIISNLLSNAMKFTDRGSVRVRAFRTSLEQGQELVFEVIDTGVGIPVDKLSFIFEKFTQADGSISRKYGGTGLGLAITRRLVQLHEGHLTVESKLGQGSSFRVFFPSDVCVSEPVTEPEPAVTASAPSEPRREKNGQSILVVEDNHVNQKVVTAILRKKGYHVDVANHGREALEYLDLLAYGLVLMDVQMPILDGLETTKVIRRDRRFRELPIVAMTAHAMSGDRERCLAAGMNGYIAKPLNPATLLRVVEEFLTRPKEMNLLPALSNQDSSLPPPEFSGLDPALILETQRSFLQAAPLIVEELHRSFSRADYSALEQRASLLALSASRIAAPRVGAAAGSLANSARSSEPDAMGKNIVTLEQEIEMLNRNLQRALQTIA